jgi:mRNA interferase MazF
VARILRGDVYWADLDPTRGHEQSGRRPVLIVSREQFNVRSGTVIAMALTSQPQRAGFPLTYALPEGKFAKPSWVKITQLRTLSTERLGGRLGRIEEAEVDRMIEGLLDIIGP